MNTFRTITLIIFITVICLLTAGCTTTAVPSDEVVEFPPTNTVEPTQMETAVPTATAVWINPPLEKREEL